MVLLGVEVSWAGWRVWWAGLVGGAVPMVLVEGLVGGPGGRGASLAAAHMLTHATAEQQDSGQ